VKRRVAWLAAYLVAFSAPVFAEPGVTADKVLVGATYSLSGSTAVIAQAEVDGIIAWLSKVNREGGVQGRQIEYRVLDDALSAQRAVTNVRRLIQQDEIFAMLGGFGTAPVAAIVSYLATRQDLPYLFPYAGLTELTEPTKRSIFGIIPSYDRQLSVMLPFAIETMETKPKTVAFLTNNFPGVDVYRKVGRAVAEAHGLSVVYDEVFDVTMPERAAFVVQMKATNPDLVVLSDAASAGAKVLLEMERQNWRPKRISGSMTLTAEQFLEPAAKFAENLVVASGFVVPPTDEKAKPCNEALAVYKKEQKPSHFTVSGCLKAQIFVEALKRAGPDLTREKLIAALENIKGFETGLSGAISFSPDQHMGLTGVVPLAVKNGTYVSMGPALTIR
jgi:branched-chain amino acid transport system substrate-binding protein